MAMTEKKWTAEVAAQLVGKTITSVSFMSEKAADDWGWSARPLEINLSDGHQLLVAADDEGNNGGSIFTTYDDLPTIPTLYAGFPKS